MPFDPVSLGIAAGTSALAPVVAKGIGSLFGLDELSPEERQAEAERADAIRRLKEQAEGRTASAAELMARQQQQRTVQALHSLASRGTAQQQAGAQRAAMQAAPEVMAQQGATAAAMRAGEMERARNALAQTQMMAAQQQAASGRANREYMQRLIGAGVQGAAGVAGMMAMQQPEAAAATTKAAPAPAAAETGTTSQGLAPSPDAKRMYSQGAAPVRFQEPAQAGSLQLQPQRLPAVGYQPPGVSLGTSQMQLKPPGMRLGARTRAALYGGQDPLDGQYKLGEY